MKRRQFITLVGASAVAAPFLVKEIAVRRSARAIPAANHERKPVAMAVSADEQRVIEALQGRSKGVYLLGGCVVAKMQQRDLPFINLLVSSQSFSELKRELFVMGVQPVSTPELPPTVIRFTYAGKPYSVVNLPLSEYLKQNTLTSELSLIPFAHNFLVYSLTDQWVIDPYNALAGKEQRIQLMQDPASPVAALTCALAGTFDMALLGLKESPRFTRMVEKCLKQIVDATAAPLIVEQVINYVPDVLELCGFQAMQQFLLSPLAVAAGRDGAGVDFRKVNSALVSAKRRRIKIDGAQLLGAINKEFLAKENPDGIGLGVSDYMASQGFMLRRTDLLMASLKLREAELAA
ncbi:MAG TPA: hypothetical protein VEH04_19100 [Verrucomicrobiae bacterium]|nr:hypothetical protein [Verrucomicrobiae bacterium]